MFGDYKQQSSDRKFVGFKRKVQHSILIDVLWKENGVLHVRVEKSALFTEKVDDFDRIAALPEEMAQITVRANFFADGLAEFHQCSGIINNKVRMHFESKTFDAVIARVFVCFLPIGDDFYFPLQVLHA